MKKLLFIALMCITGFNASAQFVNSKGTSKETMTESPRKISFGLRIGGNLSSVVGGESTGSYNSYIYYSSSKPDEFYNSWTLPLDGKGRVGFRVGVVADIPIPKVSNLYIQPGLYYVMRGSKIEGAGSIDMSGDGRLYDCHYNAEFNAGYVEIPILASYRIPVGKDMKVHLNAGPYFAYGIHGKLKPLNNKEEKDVAPWILVNNGNGKASFADVKIGDEEEDLLKLYGEDGIMKRFDLGLNFAVGFSYQKFYAELGYEFGLLNSGKTIELDTYENYGKFQAILKQEFKMRNSSLFFQLGYNF